MAKILVVDDLRYIRERLYEFISRERQEVVTAKDGMEALDTLITGGIDLVVTDLGMPNLNGYQLIDMLGNFRFPKLVVFAGGYQQRDILYKGPLRTLDKFRHHEEDVVKAIEELLNTKLATPAL